jgi:hypothetical protein
LITGASSDLVETSAPWKWRSSCNRLRVTRQKGREIGPRAQPVWGWNGRKNKREIIERGLWICERYVTRETADDAVRAGLNFFLADVRNGLGRSWAAYLAASGWNPGPSGLCIDFRRMGRRRDADSRGSGHRHSSSQKTLGEWPFVMITSPADERLLANPEAAPGGEMAVRVKAWSDRDAGIADRRVDLAPIARSAVWQAS